MSESKRWITALKYCLGTAVLLLSVAAAWLLPGWYSAWQDAKLLDQVTVSSREEVAFLDTEMMEIAERLRILSEVSEPFGWYSLEERFSGYIDYDDYVQKFYEKIEDCVKLWAENGLLPEIAEEIVKAAISEEKMEGATYGVDMGTGALTVYVFGFWTEYEEEHRVVTLIMDTDLNFIYYASLIGDIRTQEWIAEYLGYGSLQDMMGSEDFQTYKEADVPDFSKVCGANSADVTNASSVEDRKINCEAALDFGDFTGYACRTLIRLEQEYGIATIYGTDEWLRMAYALDFLERDGTQFMGFGCSTEEWLAYLEEWAEAYGYSTFEEYYDMELYDGTMSYSGSSDGEVIEAAESQAVAEESHAVDADLSQVSD